VGALKGGAIGASVGFGVGWIACAQSAGPGGGNDNTPSDEGGAVPQQPGGNIKKLSPGDIKKLQNGGINIHDLKGGKNASLYDLYKDSAGNIWVKLKSGAGEAEWTGYNIGQFK
jgi:hypothetical protein